MQRTANENAAYKRRICKRSDQPKIDNNKQCKADTTWKLFIKRCPEDYPVVVIWTDPLIRLWAQDVELLLFNVVLPWNMTSMSETTKIEKLNGKNYQSWKYSIKLVLMERGLWGFTQEGQETPPAETATTAVKNAFGLRSDKAYSLIAFEFVSVTQIIQL